MYSTLVGAKKCAKQLNHILDEAGVAYPLAKCQAAVARAGGYQDWHDLNCRIADRATTGLPYDYWGRLLKTLPEPCRAPVAWHLDDNAISRPEARAREKWIRAVVPYGIGLEIVHRSRSPILQAGSGKGQKLRLGIVSGILLNLGGQEDFTLRLDPETLTVTTLGEPQQLLPKLASKPGFDAALKAVVAAGILKVESGITSIIAPENPTLRMEILARARGWNVQKMPQAKYFEANPKLLAAVQHQYNLDRSEAGPKAPYDDLDYRGVRLSSRFSVLSEFETMQRVVDAMPDRIRLCIASIWCDSRACADYQVEVRLGMYREGLAERIRECFLLARDGFNGLSVNHGSKSKQFDPTWPADEAYYDSVDFPDLDESSMMSE